MASDNDQLEIEGELDALLGDPEAELEARFRELEGEPDLAELKARAAAAGGHAAPGPSEDPLASMKASVQGRQAEHYLIVMCPSCGGKNRAKVARLRQELPRCGRCKADLAFTR
jgi:hypothetical protein